MTLLAFNKTDAIEELWEVVCTTYIELEYQIVAARRLREAMMKASILGDFLKIRSCHNASNRRVSTFLSLYEVALRMSLQ